MSLAFIGAFTICLVFSITSCVAPPQIPEDFKYDSSGWNRKLRGVYSEYLTVNGVGIHYMETGKGEPAVLLVHGLGGSWDNWYDIIPELAKEGHRVIAMDLPGFGLSDKPDIDYKIDDFVQFLKSFIEKKKLERPVAVGHSMGGHIIIKTAARYQGLFSRIILVDSSGARNLWGPVRWFLTRFYVALEDHPYWISNRMLKFVVDLNFYDSEKGKELYYFYARARETSEWKLLLRSFCRAGRHMINDSVEDILKEIRVPTLIVWGQDDRVLPLKNAHELNMRIGDSQMAVILECGHMPMIEKPERLAAIINEFLKSVRGESEKASAKPIGQPVVLSSCFAYQKE